jgi:hypothetical protein
MRTISYPSAAFPGPPHIELDLPDGWSPLRLGGVLMAAREVSAPTGFASNVVVKGYARDLHFDVREVMRDLHAFAGDQPSGVVDDPFRLTIGGVPWLGVNVSWVDPEIGQLLQAHLIAGWERGTFLDLVHVVGAVGGGDVMRAYQSLHDVLVSVRVSR